GAPGAGRRGPQTLAGEEGRAGTAGRTRDRGELPRRGRGRARRRAAAAGQRLQGPAGAQYHRSHTPRPRGGAAMSGTTRAIGTPPDRLDGPLKVRGAATYAYEWPLGRVAYVHPLQATIAAGRIARVDATAALAEPGVLAVLTHENAPRLAATADPELAVLQS